MELSRLPFYFAATRPKCLINVASVNAAQQLSQFVPGNPAAASNFGPLVRVAAPGSDIKSANGPNTGFRDLSGTSMASPHVAGMATLLFNEFPTATAERVHDCIVNTATRPVLPNPNLPPNRPISGGIVDLQAAYQCMLTSVACPTTGLPTCVDATSGEWGLLHMHEVCLRVLLPGHSFTQLHPCAPSLGCTRACQSAVTGTQLMGSPRAGVLLVHYCSRAMWPICACLFGRSMAVTAGHDTMPVTFRCSAAVIF
jgi:subtilisin family serine protease